MLDGEGRGGEGILFIYKYLSYTNKDNSVIKEKALKYMEIGRLWEGVWVGG